MAKSFLQHTYERRQELNSHWTIEDMVYGEIGANDNGTHAIHPHFKQSNAAYPDALPMAVKEIKLHWSNIVNPHPVDFEELYARVESVIGGIHGVSFVTLYDVSLNIGCNLCPKVLPEKKVYLNADKVRDAARALVPGLSISSKDNAVDASIFDNVLSHWSPIEIEDILCIYSEEIQAGEFSSKSLREVPAYPNYEC